MLSKGISAHFNFVFPFLLIEQVASKEMYTKDYSTKHYVLWNCQIKITKYTDFTDLLIAPVSSLMSKIKHFQVSKKKKKQTTLSSMFLKNFA